MGLGLSSREACREILEGQGIRVLVYEQLEQAAADLAWMSPSLLLVPARDEARWTEILLEQSDDGVGPVDVLPDMVCLSTVPEFLWKGGGCEPLVDLLGEGSVEPGMRLPAARLLQPIMAQELIPLVETLRESRRLRRRRLARQRLEEPYLGALRVIGARSKFAVLANAARLVEQLTGLRQLAFLRQGDSGFYVEQVFGVPRRRLHRVVPTLEAMQWDRLSENVWVEVKSEVGRTGGQGIRWVFRVSVGEPSFVQMVLFARRPPHWAESAAADMRLVAGHVARGLANAGGSLDEEKRGRDPWTGLPGPDHFLAMVEDLFSRSRRSVRILFVDVEGFSEFNRRFGHLAGAFLITQVASRLVRAGADVVGRAGADSFLMALSGRSAEPPERMEGFLESSLTFDLRKVPGLVDGLGGLAPSGGWVRPIRLQIRTSVLTPRDDLADAVRRLTDISFV